MPSRLNQLAARTAVPSLLAYAGETIVHWPAGVEANAVEIQAIVDRTEQTQEFGELMDANGRKVPLLCELTIPGSVAVTTYEARPEQASVFVFDGLCWHADRVVDPGRSGGLQRITVKRAQGVTSKRTRG